MLEEKKLETKFSYCDLEIVPAVTTTISSRSECDVFYDVEDSPSYDKRMLPVFAAPMDSVADDNNYKNFEEVGITPIIHRNVNLKQRLKCSSVACWCAYSLDEFERYFCYDIDFPFPKYGNKVFALMDCANGHMEKIFTLAKRAKKLIKDYNEEHGTDYELILMGGNIANPETYKKYCDAEIDYVRCSIGTGSMCLTSANAAIGYPNASLIMEIRKIKNRYINKDKLTKIVADGGIKNYSDAVIALACGADYVMIGGLFSSLMDSCCTDYVLGYKNEKLGYVKEMYEYTESIVLNYNLGYVGNEKEQNRRDEIFNEFIESLKKHRVFYRDRFINYVSNDCARELILHPTVFKIPDIAEKANDMFAFQKKSHGMSSKEAQIGHLKMMGQDVDENKLKTSEGKTITREVKYTVKQWTDNFISYLKSAMSYTDCRDINKFNNGDIDLVIKSYGTQISVNK